ncbi:PAS domain-containing protein [Sphingomonas sp. MA1305]|uniref:histidine kinase famiy protein n=1 Tax=Sphingomonas sp. MA1305 TaxID=2479204 RepID=UPI0018E0502D|nr:histidine kinase famiy protein [Sphingomonas sp. MA1305]MBI0476453.1 PAS domain-containing protein [Sphingomonas sp. MA1305]
MADATPETPRGGPPPHLSGAANHDMSDDSNSIFFAAVKTTRMPMIVTDPNLPDNPIVFANPAFMNMTGYGWDELIGRNCRLLQGRDTDPDTISELRRSIAQRRETAVEILNYKKNGAAFWNALFMSPVFDSNGKLIYYFGSQLDVTRRRDAEEGLRQAQKMEAVGQLTGGIAHDFNNLLTVIQGFADVVLNNMERSGSEFDRQKGAKSMRAILQASERGATLTQQLLAFSRKQKLQGRIVNLVDMVDDLRPLIERTAGGRVAVRIVHQETTCNARIDPTQAELAIINILINARDAMPDGGKVTIEVSNRSVEGGDKGFGELEPGSYVMVTISDEGTGMSPEVLARVTEPFFTTKDQGKGTGLGLSMVYGFMKQSGGALRIYSEEGHGTTVRMLFPCDNAAVEPQGSQPSRPLAADKRGNETVLVVEDQVDVGDYAETVLTEFGYTVLRAENASEALELLDGAGKIDLLFSDLIMPGGMNGVMLAREVKRRRPNMNVLLTTGYAESSIERVDARGAEFELIQKPYKRTELATKVRLVIDGPTGVGTHGA